MKFHFYTEFDLHFLSCGGQQLAREVKCFRFSLIRSQLLAIVWHVVFYCVCVVRVGALARTMKKILQKGAS